jgi:hypothetical protein
MRLLLIFLLIVGLAAIDARASTAVFSKDAKHVFLLKDRSAQLVDIDLATNTSTQRDLSGSVKGAIRDLTLSNSGFILCTASNAIWSYDPATEKCVKVCSNPKGWLFVQIACDPKTGAILATVDSPETNPDSDNWPAYFLTKGSEKPIRVRARYGTLINDPVFASDGDLYFVNHGDLWEGSIGDKEPGDDGAFHSLNANRFAPFASLVDENTSPASTGLNTPAVSRLSIYANYSRMGGSGWGDLISFPRTVAVAKVSGTSPDPLDWADSSAKLFAAVKEIDDAPTEYLCTSPDGHNVFFADPYQSDKISLIENDGKPAQIEIKGLADFFK